MFIRSVRPRSKVSSCNLVIHGILEIAKFHRNHDWIEAMVAKLAREPIRYPRPIVSLRIFRKGFIREKRRSTSNIDCSRLQRKGDQR